jgi:hypothetical protein
VTRGALRSRPARWTSRAAVLALLAAACSVDVSVSSWHGGYRASVAGARDAIARRVGETLATYGAAEQDPAPGSELLLVVDGTRILVEIDPEPEGATVFVACDCPPSVPREVLEAILDDREAAGRSVARPAFGSISEPNGDTALLDELRRRRAR